MRVVINHKCGHPFTVNVLSAAALENERLLIENTDCLSCEVEADREEIEKIEKLFKGLPSLTGTKRQVAWARKIRYDYLKSLIHDRDLLSEETDDPDKHGWFFAMLSSAGNMKEAEWWIARRKLNVREIAAGHYFDYVKPAGENYRDHIDKTDAYATRLHMTGEMDWAIGEWLEKKQEEEGRKHVQTKATDDESTQYNGIEFRSRLHAQWAVFFDMLYQLRYEYFFEPRRLRSGVEFLPDFLLPQLEVFVIVGLSEEDVQLSQLSKAVEFSDENPLLLILGTPGHENIYLLAGDRNPTDELGIVLSEDTRKEWFDWLREWGQWVQFSFDLWTRKPILVFRQLIPNDDYQLKAAYGAAANVEFSKELVNRPVDGRYFLDHIRKFEE